MSFCLEDGTPLVSASSYDPGATIKIPAPRVTNQTPTEVLKEETIPPTRPALPVTEKYERPVQAVASDRKQSKLPWILGAALILGLSAIAVAWIVTRNNGSDNTQTAQKNSQSENTLQSSSTSSVTEPGADGTANKAMNPGVTPLPSPVTDTSSKTSKTSEQGTNSPKATPTPVVSGKPPVAPTPETTPAPMPARPTAPISGGVLNGKAISKPAPPYPPIAKAVHASGTVTVQVTIDESGKVISAHALSGHPLLQQSAVQAAYQARFSPTLLSGQPVKVTGVITYNFVAQ